MTGLPMLLLHSKSLMGQVYLPITPLPPPQSRVSLFIQDSAQNHELASAIGRVL